MEVKNAWIRFAGDRRAWEGDNLTDYRWRLFVLPEATTEIRIKSLRLLGPATSENNKTGWRQTKDELGVVAWIDYFGDLEIKDGVATITLREPKQSEKAP